MHPAADTSDVALSDLEPEDLTLLGKYYGDTAPLRFEDTHNTVRVLPPKAPIFSLFVLATVVAAFFVGIWLIVQRLNPEAMTIPVKLFIVLTGTLAVTGALLGHLFRIRHLQSRGTVIEFDKSKRSVSILGGFKTFNVEDVYCLLMLSNQRYDKTIASEIQVVIDGENGRQRHLLMTSLSSWPQAFIPTFQPFAKCARIRLLKARPEGVIGPGRMKVTEL